MQVMTDQQIIDEINGNDSRKFVVLTNRKFSERDLLRIARRCNYDTMTEIKNALIVEKKPKKAVRI